MKKWGGGVIAGLFTKWVSPQRRAFSSGLLDEKSKSLVIPRIWVREGRIPGNYHRFYHSRVPVSIIAFEVGRGRDTVERGEGWGLFHTAIEIFRRGMVTYSFK